MSNKRSREADPLRRAEPWTDYWQSGRKDSCNLKSLGAQPDVLTQDWTGFFSDLPPQSNVLDIGTGNGTLALLAAEVLGAEDPVNKVVGIDAAMIAPPSLALDAASLCVDLTFQGQVPAEDLPFDDNSFDCVVSQYAMEYSNLDASIPEVARVVEKGGIFRSLMHSNDSTVVKSAHVDLEAINEIVSDMELIAATRRVLKARKRRREKPLRPGSVPIAVSPSEASLLDKLSHLEARAGSSQATEHHRYFLQTLSELLRRDTVPMTEQYLEFMDQLEAEMDSFRKRLEQMLDAAMNGAQMEAVAEIAQSFGLMNVQYEKRREGDATFGWLLTGTARN